MSININNLPEPTAIASTLSSMDEVVKYYTRGEITPEQAMNHMLVLISQLKES